MSISLRIKIITLRTKCNMSKQPRLLKKVYEQVKQHEDYHRIDPYIRNSLDGHFGEPLALTGNTHLDIVVNMINDIRTTDRQYMNKMLRNTWDYLYTGQDTLSQYDITVDPTNPYYKFTR